jgi:hypothetical protein
MSYKEEDTCHISSAGRTLIHASSHCLGHVPSPVSSLGSENRGGVILDRIFSR